MSIQTVLAPLFRKMSSLEREVERLKVREGAPRRAPYASTIASDSVGWMRGYHTLVPESGTADDLSTITGGKDGDRVTLRAADSGDTITVRDGTGNLALAGDCVLGTPRDTLSLIYDAALSLWLETGRSING